MRVFIPAGIASSPGGRSTPVQFPQNPNKGKRNVKRRRPDHPNSEATRSTNTGSLEGLCQRLLRVSFEMLRLLPYQAELVKFASPTLCSNAQNVKRSPPSQQVKKSIPAENFMLRIAYLLLSLSGLCVQTGTPEEIFSICASHKVYFTKYAWFYLEYFVWHFENISKKNIRICPLIS